MMNRTFVIIAPKLQDFAAPDWEVWFTVKLIPILPSFTAEMLLEVTADVNCTNYHVIVEGMGDVFLEMTSTRRQEITRVLVERLKEFAVQFNSPDCRKDIGSDAEWLDINLGLFSKVANYTDLKELNISGLAALESLSPDQKAELLLDPSTGAIENVPVVKEVLSSILKSRDEEQLEKFFETFVEENITYITNAGVRDAILNLTLTALAPKFPLFQTSDYELWFQINLVVLLASFRPSVLVVIPANLTCDSYDAVLKGLENALAVLPSGIGVELKSSIGELRQSAPEGCTPPRPVGVCEETVVDEGRLCESVNRDGLGSQVPSSDRLCDFGISEYACSSVASSLSAGDLVTLLTCKQPNSTTGAEAWKLFFQKVAGVLEVALSAYSSTNLSDRQPEPHVLDAIGEVKVNNFSATQLTDVSFVAPWFQGRLRPFLPAASKDFLSCLSSKNFSCDTYQVVVQALSRQASLMEVGQQRLVFADFVLLFLSRDDLADPACLAKTTRSADWLEKNFGNFSVYATLEQLQTLNANFSSYESLTLLSPSQVAELTLSSGALNSTNQIDAVFDRLEDGDAFKNVEEFLTTLTAKHEASQ
ncbi:putative threonine-rich GPI-anchored glyco isoform X2 [Labeo rohita]|uniref:Putative threonine-rich GPI-anchored glyco isoform X2 n=1 Tax=Labeo rohita TaxID=84645 RepID=A0A498NJX9_LABRO|nr:putative threonine-rich GPI-anchored glyco isoform X2 [Labeo rohita]